jgi:hypothetical protein
VTVVHTYYTIARKSLMRKDQQSLVQFMASMRGRDPTDEDYAVARAISKSELVDRVLEVHDALPMSGPGE